MKTLYIIRHCRAEGQEPEAQLTPEGRLDAEELSDKLSTALGGEKAKIVSSPYERAMGTIEPFASRNGFPVEGDHRLVERKSMLPLPANWLEVVMATIDDPDRDVDGWESARCAMARGREAVEDALRNSDTVVIATHGNMTVLLLKSFCPTLVDGSWRETLRAPDVFRVEVGEDGETTLSHLL
jgi:2,3-bisphosphoglycerate-dependent phosphoglycerate mutase